MRRSGLPFTAADYRALPYEGARYQLVEGELEMAPSPNRYHQQISINLISIFARCPNVERLGRLYHAPLDVYLDDLNVYQPDLLFVSAGNSGVLAKAGIEGVPDFAIEILSPSTSHLDLGAKRRIFAKHGLRELWIIDPVDQVLDVYRRPDFSTASRRCQLGERLTSSIFPGIEFVMAEIFAG